MTAWLGVLAQFLPLILVVSLVCTAMKEDDIPAILVRGLRLSVSLATGTALFCVVVSLVIWVAS